MEELAAVTEFTAAQLAEMPLFRVTTAITAYTEYLVPARDGVEAGLLARRGEVRARVPSTDAGYWGDDEEIVDVRKVES